MTTFNVTQFKASIGDGGVRPNQFMVSLAFPAFVSVASQAVAQAPMLVHSAELPGTEMPPATVMYRGRAVHFAGDKEFAPFTFSFYNDSGLVLRTAFEEWLNGMEDQSQKFGTVNPTQYWRDVEVHQLDRNGQVKKSYKLIDAMPVSVGGVGLGFEMNNQVSSTTVTLRYQTFEFSPATGGAVGFGQIFNQGF